jgi:DNA (cytosine-5)-methyltransferase 1
MKILKNTFIFFVVLGYSSYWKFLNGADFGCPQNRERVFMISVLNGNKDDVKKE